MVEKKMCSGESKMEMPVKKKKIMKEEDKKKMEEKYKAKKK